MGAEQPESRRTAFVVIGPVTDGLLEHLDEDSPPPPQMVELFRRSPPWATRA